MHSAWSVWIAEIADTVWKDYSHSGMTSNEMAELSSQ